uniref:Uncharacterized protein n=1 Tax=Anguilla anguilla TaxID=7936 RepID=A0A0E9QZG4_ANGAN
MYETSVVTIIPHDITVDIGHLCSSICSLLNTLCCNTSVSPPSPLQQTSHTAAFKEILTVKTNNDNKKNYKISLLWHIKETTNNVNA